MEATKAVHAASRRMPRFHKYAIGAQMQRQSIEVITLIARANVKATRPATLPLLCAAADNLRILVDVAHEVQALASFAEYALLAEKVVDLARQAQAWRRHSEGPAGPERAGDSRKGAT